MKKRYAILLFSGLMVLAAAVWLYGKQHSEADQRTLFSESGEEGQYRVSKDRVNGGSPGLMMNESVFYPENEPPYIAVKQNGNWAEISTLEDYPSRPIISPDQTKLAFISPFEFEMTGDVWLYDALTLTSTIIYPADRANKESAKQLLWADDSHVVILVGNTYGTITLNRTLYMLDVTDLTLERMVQVELNQDLRDITMDKSSILSLNVVTYNDEMMEEQSEFRTFDLKRFITHGSISG